LRASGRREHEAFAIFSSPRRHAFAAARRQREAAAASQLHADAELLPKSFFVSSSILDSQNDASLFGSHFL